LILINYFIIFVLIKASKNKNKMYNQIYNQMPNKSLSTAVKVFLLLCLVSSQAQSCTDNSECGANVPYCIYVNGEGTCGCSSDSDCLGRGLCTNSVCSCASSSECGQLYSDPLFQHNLASTVTCDSTSQFCGQVCITDAACTNPMTPHCQTDTGVCGCTTDSQCQYSHYLSCNTKLGVCTGCSDNGECPHGQYCGASGMCFSMPQFVRGINNLESAISVKVAAATFVNSESSVSTTNFVSPKIVANSMYRVDIYAQHKVGSGTTGTGSPSSLGVTIRYSNQGVSLSKSTDLLTLSSGTDLSASFLFRTDVTTISYETSYTSDTLEGNYNLYISLVRLN
jgi:hypothetical protein